MSLAVDVGRTAGSDGEDLLAVLEEHGRQATLLEACRRLAVDRARYRDLFDLFPGGCLITDLDGVVVEANLAAAGLAGWQ